LKRPSKSAGDATSGTHACSGRWKQVRIMVSGAVLARMSGEP